MSDYAFGIGMNTMRFAPIPAPDPDETPTARTERIRAAQDRRVPHDPPPADPESVMREWMMDPERRMGALSMRVMENPDLLPQCELEPGPGEAPRPGGLVERVYAMAAERVARAGRNWNR